MKPNSNKQMKITTKTKTLTKTITTHKFGNVGSYRVIRENGKIIEQGWQNKKIAGLELTPIFTTTNKFDDYFTKLFYDDSESYIEDTDVLRRIKTQDFSNLYYLHTDGNMLFDTDLNPIPTDYHAIYIQSHSQRYPGDTQYDQILEKLRAHPFTVKLIDHVIPHYTSDFGTQRGIERWRIRPDVATYRKMWSRAIQSEYSSISLKDQLSYCKSYQIEGEFAVEDIYGIKELLIKQQECTEKNL